jgi:hypothetical protein
VYPSALTSNNWRGFKSPAAAFFSEHPTNPTTIAAANEPIINFFMFFSFVRF